MTVKERARRMMEAVDTVISIPSYLEDFVLRAISSGLKKQDKEIDPASRHSTGSGE